MSGDEPDHGESLSVEKTAQCGWVKRKLDFPGRVRRMDGRWTLRYWTFIAIQDDKKAAEVVRDPRFLPGHGSILSGLFLHVPICLP